MYTIWLEVSDRCNGSKTTTYQLFAENSTNAVHVNSHYGRKRYYSFAENRIQHADRFSYVTVVVRGKLQELCVHN